MKACFYLSCTSNIVEVYLALHLSASNNIITVVPFSSEDYMAYIVYYKLKCLLLHLCLFCIKYCELSLKKG